MYSMLPSACTADCVRCVSPVNGGAVAGGPGIFLVLTCGSKATVVLLPAV